MTVGLEPSVKSRATTWLSRGLTALLHERPELADEEGARRKQDGYDFDVIIVGSGYGGAVAAAELSACKDADGQPLTICLLERGKEYLAGMFPSRLADLAGHVRFATPYADRQRGVHDGLYDIRWSEDAVALVGSGLGGGSLVNAGVMEMPLPQIFREARWPTAIRKDVALNELSELLRPWLGARPMTPTRNNPELAKTKALKKLAGSIEADLVHITVASEDSKNAAGVEMTACQRCGDCATGCNYNAKDSLDLNLLRLAEQEDGTQIVTGATVLRVAPADASAGGWLLYVNHTDSHLRDRQQKPFVLRAKRVILAAGTFGSTEILLRSQGELQLSPQLGRKFSANGDMIAVAHEVADQVSAVADETQDPAEGRAVGPSITAMIDLRKGLAETDVVIQDLAIPGPLRRLFEEGVTTADVLNRLADGDRTTHDNNPARADDAAVNASAFQRSLVVAMIGRDDAEGELRLGLGSGDEADGLLTVNWPELRLDPRFDKHHRLLGSLIRKSNPGGKLISNLLWRPLSEKLEYVFGRQRGPLLTVHPLGGCAMGDNVRQGVTDHRGLVFDASRSSLTATYEGLAVLDGSIIPTSLGINPALTIAVLALRAITELKVKWGLSGQRLHASPPDRARVSRPSFSTPRTNATPTPTEIELTEQMRGVVNLRGRDGKIRPHTVELTLTTDRVALSSLIAHEASGGRCLVVAPATKGTPAQGKLRILRAGKKFDRVSDEVDENEDVALVAEVSGSIRILALERSVYWSRVLRALWAWLRNRGMRDVVQTLITHLREWLRLIPPPAQPRQKWKDYIRDLLRLCSRAGAVRLIEYAFRIDAVSYANKADFEAAMFEQGRISGVKRLTYALHSTPWGQLLELTLKAFPQMGRHAGKDEGIGIIAKNPPILKFNELYLARKAVPLLRIVGQQDRVAALTDLLSFGLYMLRVLLQVHALSFRKPDPPAARPSQRLPGALPGLRIPQIDWLIIDRDSRPPAYVRLARYDGRAQQQKASAPKRPVLLVHGYSASGTTFAHPAIPGNLVQTLFETGRDVWVLDLRSSAGLTTASGEWAFEEMAEHDIPIAIKHVLAASGGDQTDVVAHCMGAAMFSMAVLSDRDRNGRPNRLHEKIGRVVFSQVGPVMMLSSANVLAAYIMRYVRHFVPLEDYVFSPPTEREVSLAGQLLDRALAAMPRPPGEYRRENPLWPPGKATPWVGTRRRMDALYARTFSLANLTDDVLDHIDDFFGPLSVQTVSQVIHFAGFNTVTDRFGNNRYVTPFKIRQRLRFPMMSIHGGENGLADPATLTLMRDALTSVDVPYLNASWDAVENTQSVADIESLIDTKVAPHLALGVPSYLTWRIAGYGHQDCLIGKHAGLHCGVIARYLGKPDIETEQDRPLATGMMENS